MCYQIVVELRSAVVDVVTIGRTSISVLFADTIAFFQQRFRRRIINFASICGKFVLFHSFFGKF